MKFLLVLIFSIGLTNGLTATLANAQSSCEIGLTHLVRAGAVGESDGDLRPSALFKYLVSDKHLLFGPIHYRALEDASNASEVRWPSEYLENISYFTPDVRRNLAIKTWSNIKDEIDVSNILRRSIRSENRFSYQNTDHSSPDARWITFDPAKLTANEIKVLANRAKLLGVTYEDIFELNRACEAIDSRKETYEEVIAIIQESIDSLATLTVKEAKARDLNASSRRFLTNGDVWVPTATTTGFTSFLAGIGVAFFNLDTPMAHPVLLASAIGAAPMAVSGSIAAFKYGRAKISKAYSAISKNLIIRRSKNQTEKRQQTNTQSESE